MTEAVEDKVEEDMEEGEALAEGAAMAEGARARTTEELMQQPKRSLTSERD
jgi:hypothetical protein